MQVLSITLPSELHNPPCSPTTGSGTDPALSLREAALLTLKSKRRKPNLGHSHRPVYDDASFRLDYGQALETTPPAGPLATTLLPVLAAENWEVEEGQIREEGEISDTEGTPPRPSKLEASISESTAVFPSTKSVEVGSVSHLRDNSNEALQSSAVAAPCEPISIIRSYDLPFIDTSSYALEIDQVRPGLTMTQVEFAMAKDLVLDLLGWGVLPEYLVEFGLSREIIYYVFRELNLRFPANLDTTGLIPYPPTPSISQSSQLAIAPQSTPVQSEMDSIGALQHTVPHNSGLPVKPPKFSRQKSISSLPIQLTNQGLATASAFLLTSAISVSSPLADSAVVSSTSLHDMEQQRRQELMARKAVQASRKPKPLLDEDSTYHESGSYAHSKDQEDQDAEMVPHVPERSVDDFLNSIGSVPFVDNGNPNNSRGVPSFSNPSPVDMDIDSVAPGTFTPPASARFTTPPRSPLSFRSSLTSVYTNSMSSIDQTPDHTPPSASTEPPLASHPHALTDSPGLIVSHLREPENIKSSAGPIPISRRGTKRPVAADFVDFDPGPSRQYSGNGGVNNSSSRKPGSFASVSGMRRCVIDLSDSDDDGSMGAMRVDQVADADHERGEPSYTATMYDNNGETLPNTPTSSDVGAMSPAVLMVKEREIRKMRELIAQREQNRLKKLAMSSRPTPANHRLPSQPVKQEEEDTNLEVKKGRMQHNVEKDMVMQDSIMHETVQLLSTSVDLTTDLAVSSRSSSSSASPSIDDSVPNVMDHLGSGEEALKRVREKVAGHSRTYSKTAENEWQQDTRLYDQPAQSLALLRPEEEAKRRFTAYDSPFEWYPLLRSHSRPVVAGDDESAEAWHSYCSSSPSSSVLFPLPSLKTIKLAAVANLLDPSKRICQYEIPGGGVCRDGECEDIHLSQVVGVDLNDRDTAQYIHNALPVLWQGRCSVRNIEEALGGVRQRNSVEGKTSMDLESRIAQALFILGQGLT